MSTSPTWNLANPAALTLGWMCKCCNAFHPSGTYSDGTMQRVLLADGRAELRTVIGGHISFSEAHTPIVWAKMAAEDLETIERNAQQKKRSAA